MRTITSFPNHQVRRREEFPRTADFVRDRSRILAAVCESLAQARLARFNRSTPPEHSASCVKYLEKLRSELGPPHPLLRILDVVRWYEAHWHEGLVPWVEGGPSLYSKFSRLEAIMLDRTRQEPTTTVDEVLTNLFNGSKIVSEAFKSDILVRAKRLSLGSVSEVDLMTRLGELYGSIRAARVPEAAGPIDLLRRYINWLSEKDWQMTMRVLSTSSPAFQQFRREEASLHPLGADPLTGR